MNSRIMNVTQKLLSFALAPLGLLAFVAALLVILASIVVSDTVSKKRPSSTNY